MDSQVIDFWWILPLILLLRAVMFTHDDTSTLAFYSLSAGIIVGHYVDPGNTGHLGILCILYLSLFGLISKTQSAFFVWAVVTGGIIIGLFLK